MAIPVAAGAYIPMLVVIETGESDLDVTARLINRATLEVVADDVPLYYQGGTAGEYVSNDEVEMPDVDFVDAIYSISDSSGNLLRKAGETFVNSEIYGGGGGGGASVGEVVGIIQSTDSLVGIIDLCQ